MSQVELLAIIDNKIEQVRTKSLDLSFNEIVDMYRDGEFEISPAYQRLFRWSEEKQSQFIESLILEMPIPPIYVIEKDEGQYELIDGLQRISTYLHFRGELANPNNHSTDEMEEENVRFLTLTGCDIVKELNGLTYEKLPKTLQIRLKRSFVRVEVIRKGSDSRLRYYMFKRLNTGGELLSEQEIRNCTIRLLDDTFNDFIIELSGYSHFQNTISHLNEEKIEKKEDQEYVLKYFAYKLDRENYKKNISSFLTTFMEKVSDEGHEEHIKFDYEKERKEFEKTFEILDLSLGEYAFDKLRKGKYISGITSTHFDAFTMGIQPYLNIIDTEDTPLMEQLGEVFKAIKLDQAFLDNASGGGKNTKNYLSKRIEVVQKRVGDFLDGRS
ncbi:hypothetical protein B4064_3851 [Caldibacillus thermoamylovorans]|nr:MULTISPECIES: DUF262 domain-containing protein [Bacillaceae]MCB5935481.1 DUF262 domain-containing protein [Bacillus sp. DFI.2.34]AWI14282.1 DUF262 domain-containing protein [Caldibacillus thermoamylovorans]KIO55145.1 hypothetical protein B4064_3851 [Caldibacillus thermoamylovorans]KIO56670.1 hypothetical protein B4065_3830 [Caldibacillus thermoamylovorans]MCB7070839.1 DUF262 domain-containing protein [Caldibacillus sp. 210928-DFI.2.22]